MGFCSKLEELDVAVQVAASVEINPNKLDRNTQKNSEAFCGINLGACNLEQLGKHSKKGHVVNISGPRCY